MRQVGLSAITTISDSMGGFGRSVAEVKQKWLCRKSQMKGNEAAVKWPNESSRVKTGRGTIRYDTIRYDIFMCIPKPTKRPT